MKRFTEQLNKKATAVKLRAAEKQELRERVVSYMEYHPLSVEQKALKTKIGKQVVADRQFNEAFATFKVPFFQIFKYGAVVTAMVLLVIPAVAERAVPGDTLYAVKVRFNEEVKSTLTFDTYEKVEWETERLNRRIAEARLLASEGRLTKEAEAGVADAVREHTANAKKGIELLRSEDEDAATIASLELDSTLEVQSSSLKEEAIVASASAGDPELALKPVNLIANAIDESLDQGEVASSTLPAYDKLMARVESNTTRIYELLASLEKLAPTEELVEVSRRVSDIDRALQEAVETAKQDELKAREQLVSSVQRTQKLIVYMTELEVIKSVDIETLIPVVLTEAEEEISKSEMSKELEQKLVTIDTLSATVTDVEKLAKIDASRQRIGLALVDTLPNSQDYATYKAVASESLALADDILKLLQPEGAPEIVVPAVNEATSTATTSVIQSTTTSATTTTTI